ncbi:MAG: acetyl-CoA C-acyltransferase [Planctomycetaceae bacterium]|jgi:acetyl-CoA acyltransferase|nr:acetyl-CoA C-acyltransferase [Planctomycetaceae bacterium]
MNPGASRDPATTPVVVACCRTAIGRAHPDRGIFRHVRGDELAAAVIAAVVDRSGVEPATIEDVVLGATQQRGELGGNAGRCAALMAGLPLSTAGTTVNRLCGSSLQALAQACHAIAAGAENVQVVAGVEHMHHLPMDSAVDIHPRVFARSSRGMLSMGLTAEQLAAAHGISRRRQEEYALESHARAARAGDAGLFDDEIVPVFGHDEHGAAAEMLHDQSIRRDTSLEAMATLEPAFLPQLGTITAATSAPVSDGAAAVLVMSEAEAARQQLEPWARVVATAVVGVPPAAMGTGPIAATEKLLARVAGRGIGRGDIGLVELNEAFAAQAIHCIDALGFDSARVNVRGGALAIGHPLGASGARITTTLLHAMRDAAVPLGLATMCIGLGQGIAVLFERCE